MSNLVSHEDLKRIIDYDPETGIFVWKEKISDKVVVGSNAGCETKNSCGNATYLFVGIYNKLYRGHRLAWFYHYGVWPKGVVDHINHDGLDNSIKNLRDLSIQGNSKNTPLSKANKSGVCGVCWDRAKELWLANIRIDGVTRFLGYFEDFNDAVTCRQNAQKELGFHDNHGKPFGGRPPEKKRKLSGITFDKAANKFRVQIRVKHVYVQIGYFEDWFEAVCARKSAENAYFTGANRGGVLADPPKKRYKGINGAVGVNFVKQKGLWVAFIKDRKITGGRVHLGFHKTFDDAVVARKIAEDEIARGLVPSAPGTRAHKRKTQRDAARIECHDLAA
jgi:hypothetical protein